MVAEASVGDEVHPSALSSGSPWCSGTLHEQKRCEGTAAGGTAVWLQVGWQTAGLEQKKGFNVWGARESLHLFQPSVCVLGLVPQKSGHPLLCHSAGERSGQ